MAKTVDGAEYPVAAYASDPFVVRVRISRKFTDVCVHDYVK